MNGCHNRAQLRKTAWVQSGWKYEYNYYVHCDIKIPLMIEIPDPMSKACIYQRDKKDDPKCTGCKELEA